MVERKIAVATSRWPLIAGLLVAAVCRIGMTAAGHGKTPLLAAGAYVLLLFYKCQVIARADLTVAPASGRRPAIKIVRDFLVDVGENDSWRVVALACG